MPSRVAQGIWGNCLARAVVWPLPGLGLSAGQMSRTMFARTLLLADHAAVRVVVFK